MVVEEILNENLVRHYSDAGRILLQVETGTEYADAIDAVPCRFAYVETDRKIEEAEHG